MRTKQRIAVIIIALLTVFMLAACLLCLPSTYAVYAAESEVTETTGENLTGDTAADGDDSTSEETPAEGETELTDKEKLEQTVKEYLQNIYGDNYETYYNQIIENYGSLEEWVVKAGNNVLPEEYQYKLTELMNNVKNYIGVIADGLLLVIGVVVIIVYAVKKKSADEAQAKISETVEGINETVASVIKAINQIEGAESALIANQAAQSSALRALMPNAKFTAQTDELAASETELKAAAEEVKKDVNDV